MGYTCEIAATISTNDAAILGGIDRARVADAGRRLKLISAANARREGASVADIDYGVMSTCFNDGEGGRHGIRAHIFSQSLSLSPSLAYVLVVLRHNNNDDDDESARRR